MSRLPRFPTRVAQLAAVLIVAGAAPAFGNQVTINVTGVSAPVFDSGNNLVGWGGEFAATESGITLSSAYAAGGTGSPSLNQFITFCVQLNQDINANVPYDYTLSQNLNFANGSSEALTVGTAWLYSQFVQGTLAGYTYPTTAQLSAGAPTTLSGASAALLSSDNLQNAFWALQGETLGTDFNNPTALNNQLANPFIELVAQQFSSGLYSVGGSTAAEQTALANALAATTASANYGVQVMNLVNANGTPVQNQLVMTAPDGGLTLLLLGSSLIGLALIGRRSRQTA